VLSGKRGCGDLCQVLAHVREPEIEIGQARTAATARRTGQGSVLSKETAADFQSWRDWTGANTDAASPLSRRTVEAKATSAIDNQRVSNLTTQHCVPGSFSFLQPGLLITNPAEKRPPKFGRSWIHTKSIGTRNKNLKIASSQNGRKSFSDATHHLWFGRMIART
jgi:hypothetical protein